MKLRLFEWGLFIVLVFLTVACSKDGTTNEPIKLKPSDFTVSITDKGLGYNFAEINWTASTVKNKSIIVYDIYLDEELKGKDIDGLKYRFETLQPNTKYSVKVVAKSAYKTQTVANYTFTTVDTPAPKAISIKVDKVQPESISVSWTTEDDNLKYDIFLDEKKVATDQDVDKYTFTNLGATTLYKVKIVGKNIHNKSSQAVVDVTTIDYSSPEDFLVSIKEVNANDITIEWTQLDPLLAYSVFVNGVLDTEKMFGSEYHIQKLTELTKYTIRVVAINSNNKTTAKEIVVTTPEAAAPNDFTVEISNISREYARVCWKVSKPYDLFGVDYQIFLNDALKFEAHNDGTFLFEGLEEGTIYEVKIIAINANQKKLIKTEQFKTLAAPTLSDFSVSSTDITQTSATLKWTNSVSSDGLPVMYRIYDEADNLIMRDITSQEYRVNYLLVDKEYTYQVEAYTSTFEILKKVPVTFSTLAYETPTDFTISVSELTDEKAKLEWTKSTLSTGKSVSYEIYDRGKWSNNNSSLEYLALDLKPNTSYTIKVAAISPDGKRNEKSISFTTKPEPEATLNYSIERTETNMVSLKFDLEGARVDFYQLSHNNRILYKGAGSNFEVKELVSNTDYNFTLLAETLKGKTYSKEIHVRTKAHLPVIDFTISYICFSYTEPKFSFEDFYNKNRSQYPDIDGMKLEYYIDGYKYESQINETVYISDKLKPDTHYDCRIVIKHSDGTIVCEKDYSFTTIKNIAPNWEKGLSLKSKGFGFVEFENVQAKDWEPGLQISNYKYFINGIDITNIGYINARGNGQVKRGVNANGESIIISNLEADKDYDFYIIAIDKDGATVSSNKVNFRTATDPVSSFDLSVIESVPGIFTFSWDENASIPSIKEIRVQLTVDGKLFPRSKYIGGSSCVAEVDGKFLVDLDLSAIIKAKPNAIIEAALILEWIDNEPIRKVTSKTITIH